MPRKKATKKSSSSRAKKAKSLPTMDHKHLHKAPMYKQAMKRKTPLGVKILSILWYIGSALLVIMALLLFTASAFIVPLLIESYPFWASLGAGIAAIIGIFCLIFAVLYFFIAKALMRGKNWARILVIVLSLLGIIGAFAEIFTVGFASSIIKLIYNGVIVWYLAINENTKRFFERR